MKSYFLIHKKQFMMYIFVSMIYGIILAGTGFVYSMLTNAALGNNFQYFIWIAIFSIGFLFVDSLFDYVPRYVRSKLVNEILHSLRSDLVDHYLEEDLQSMMKENPAERTNKLVHSIEVVENSYLRPLLSCLLSIFVFIFSLAGAFYLQGTLTLIMLALCFLPFLAPIINQNILSDKKQEAQDRKKRYLSKFEDFSRNIAPIRLMNASPIFANLLKKSSEETATYAVAFEKGQAKTYAVSYGLSSIVYSGTWIIGGVFVFRNLLTVPELIAMTTLMGTVAGPIQTISGLTTELISSKKVVSEFVALVNKDTERTDQYQIQFNEQIETLELDNIAYQVEEQILFKDLSFTFERGKKYAIIGESGVGKSTLLQLLMGIVSSDSGAVRMNGKEIKTFEKRSYYQHFTYVPQKTAMFNGTIAQNVSMFKEIDEEMIAHSLNRAGLKEWLDRQPDGVHSILSANNPLSGGEERRLDIARSLYRESEMIILDEPTSGLDQKNERIISSVIQNLSDKLVIVVTHSSNHSFLESFDELLQLDKQQLTTLDAVIDMDTHIS